MRRTILAASALTLGLLIPQGTGLGLGAALAQDRDESESKQSAAADKKASRDKASKTETSKADVADKSPSASNDSQQKRAKARRAKVSEAAQRGELEQRNHQPATAPITALDPTLEPSSAPGATTSEPPVADPNLRRVPPVLKRQPTAANEAANDQALRERVQASLLQNSALPYTARLVSVAVKNGEITLRGQLNTHHEKVTVERAVAQVRGDHIVHNELLVRSPSAVTRSTPVE